MRILLLSPPRSCSTALCDLLAGKFNLKNLQNVIDEFSSKQSMKIDEIYQYLAETDNYVAKVHSTQFYAYRDYTAVPWSAVDSIIFTERQNKLNQVASFLLRMTWEDQQANSIPQGEIDVRQFSESNFVGEVDISKLAFIKYGFIKYDEVKQYLIENFSDKCTTVNYESFQLDTPQEVAQSLSSKLGMSITDQDLDFIIEKKTNIDYAVNITNYTELVDAYNGYFLK